MKLDMSKITDGSHEHIRQQIVASGYTGDINEAVSAVMDWHDYGYMPSAMENLLCNA